MEYTPKGICVNAACPTFVCTRIVTEELKHDETELKSTKAIVPIKRMNEAQDVNNAAA